jgi:RNA polymerase primary sigma factor
VGFEAEPNGFEFEEAESSLRAADGEVDAIDDPVRMYLMQMGRIPLLTRHEEVASAKEIERTRFLYRNSMIATDFILQGAVTALEKVRDGQLRLDRTIEVSVTNTAEKKRILKRLTPNLVTLRHLLKTNQRDFRVAIDRRQPMAQRRKAWAALTRRRHKAVRLIEELNLRINRLQPLFEKLAEISSRMIELHSQIRATGKSGVFMGRTVEELRRELHYLMRISFESPWTLKRRIERTREFQQEHDAASESCRQATCGWSFRSPRSIATAG